MRSRMWFFGVVGLSAMLAACGSKTPSNPNDGIGNAGSSNNEAGASGSSAGTDGYDGLIDDEPDAGGVVCRTEASCAELECGPIADGCGDFIQCGGCEAPMQCGGAGVPSECGVPGTGGGSCTPATCDSLGVSCGQHGDGCGGVVVCNACTVAGEECIQGQCQATAVCTPLTCADYPEAGRCGPVSNGCSEIMSCGFGSCPDNQVCGAQEPGFCGTVTCQAFATCEEALADKPIGYCGFVSNNCDGEMVGCATVCGVGEFCDVSGDEVCEVGSGGGCTPEPEGTACAGKCGVLSDGCSDTYDCGACADGQLCGANQTPNVCGVPACIPTTCAEQNAACGEIDDGCGNPLDCGTCTNGDTCSGGGVPFQCGQPGCDPLSQSAACALVGAECGTHSDGCDGTVNCGACSNGETCGGGGQPNQCGTACVPQTCEDLGATCGPQGDGCGEQINCGGCPQGQGCQGNPSQCVPVAACTNYCQNQAVCTPSTRTSISGKVYAPNGTEPLYNALVYVPNIDDLGDLPAITTGPNCLRCEDEDLGEPLVAAITGPDGSFTLENVPAGVDFPLVVKMGKWRRVTMIPGVAACSDNVLIAEDARMPRHMNDAAPGLTQHVNIPRFAMVTGQVDAIECVLRKIGIADSEFTTPAGNGRIRLFKGDNNGTSSGGSNGAGTGINGTGTSVSTLFSNNALNNYDVAVFDCEGPNSKPDSWRTSLRNFANAGGRVFASHYSYEYLEDNGNFDTVATWGGGEFTESNTNNPTTGMIDTSHSKGQAFDAWLGHVNAHHPTYGDGYISIRDPRGYVDAVSSTLTERYVRLDANHVVPGFTGTGAQPNGNINVDTAVEQFAFNTPVGATPANACGRVLYSAFHVTGQGIPNFNNSQFPAHCNSDPLTAQEKVLEFMIFDLSSCVSVSVPPSCDPVTCEEANADCGYMSDGCGGIQNCGTCQSPETCGGGGTPNQCGSSCTLTSCASAGATCGTIGDGCGGTINCGTCAAGSVCGGGGTANVCGTPACTPRSCVDANATCGNIGDGCGGTLNCGTCPQGQFCGGGGANTCGSGQCTPTGCGSAECGSVGDGCGNAINCGTCDPGSVCGAGGANICGPVCTPTTCDAANKNCGFIGDGCGGVLNCGICSEGAVCGGDGVANVCGADCDPVTCAEANAACGTVGDGCGGVVSCGGCPIGQVCGANTPNQCGAGSCTPDTCGGGDCGIISDGCSGTLDCGPCNGCVPFSCVPSVDCGPVADGCGALIDCGVCTNGNTCGGGGQASKCGGRIQ